MPSLLSKLSDTPKSKPIEPREIFMALPKKDKRYEYPRDVQSEVWKKWFKNRGQKNTIIKMNTGSGKTVVGLMILQSCLNEEKGPAIYVVPDKYLAAQVCNEAEKLGILAVTNKDNYNYTENKAILVATIHELVNGRSVFGMREYNNYPIGSVLLDDVHACLDTITSQFSIHITSKHELYKEIITLIEDSWKEYDSTAYTNIVEIEDPQKTALLPFWIWQEKQREIYRLLKKYDNDKEENHCIFFSLPLLQDCLSFCNCIITSRSIEITTKGIPISKITSFENANRRIFMSATLADDSVFVSAIGLKKEEITDIITPDKADDMGDRLILFPKHLNNTITDEQIKSEVLSIATKYNVVVIVPSIGRGLFWDETGKSLVTKDNIEIAVAGLKQKHIGLVVLVNRYDGIDLPDDSCRLLVIDGLPPLRSEYDKYVQNINPSSNLLLREQIQRIEQGMGRGVRSNSDSCCVVLMGDKLADVLLRNKGTSYFSNATTAQYNLSKELWELLIREKPEPDIDEIFELADYSLNREVEWIEKSKARLSSVIYKTSPNIEKATIALREAFEHASIGQWQKSVEALDLVINQENDNNKGFIMQIKAEYTNFFDSSKAQQILQAARRFNLRTLIPISGIQYDKLVNNKKQAKAVLEYLSKFSSDPNKCVIHISAVLDDLTFSANTNEFEDAFQEVGEMLGFKSSRPDKETSGAGPDNLWAMGNGKYLVVECKSGATTDTISKDYCNQLGGSVRWFFANYAAIEYQCTPVMIHKTNSVDNLATPPGGMRVITPGLIDNLKKQIRDFTTALVQAENWLNETQVNSLLLSYKLRRQDIIQEYTTAFSTN